ncbi:hypothetical protein I317_02114 [Kwoniella heveanensis CBS 569]|nr:hypothetical protein I317_02114 [Kwoniella heveanensis CBS 569]
MALASTSSLRSLRALAQPGVSANARAYYASIAPYSPPSFDTAPVRRPPRPASPEFFTGRPTFNESLSALSSTIKSTQSSLREKHVYPLPSHLPTLSPPRASWVSSEELSSLFDVKLRTNTLRQVMELLTELHHLRHISDMSGYPELVQQINQALQNYERDEAKSSSERRAERDSAAKVDKFGRAYGMGRKKTSSARVWMIPTPSAQNIFASTSNGTSAQPTTATAAGSPASSSVLINHVPLATYFPRPSDRETILRPLRISGFLGAFNIFAFARGGGVSGQAGAVALGVARALAILRDDAKDVLLADGALMRDTRMVERKKTGRAKARKGYTWVKR